ncbi:MAG: hypothetical protein IJT69_05270 [Clostridia bacterium]|nr:hypothetical protein [Clostridia bacterium]
MIALSVFAAACGFFAAASVGLWLKRKLIRKASFYEGYYDYLLFAYEKISYERMPIGELNAQYLLRKNGEFSSYLKGETTKGFLSDGQLAEVKEYLDGIGTTDADTQIASLASKCSELKRFTETECTKYRKDGALYFKLSVLVGVAILILLA